MNYEYGLYPCRGTFYIVGRRRENPTQTQNFSRSYKVSFAKAKPLHSKPITNAVKQIGHSTHVQELMWALPHLVTDLPVSEFREVNWLLLQSIICHWAQQLPTGVRPCTREQMTAMSDMAFKVCTQDALEGIVKRWVEAMEVRTGLTGLLQKRGPWTRELKKHPLPRMIVPQIWFDTFQRVSQAPYHDLLQSVEFY